MITPTAYTTNRDATRYVYFASAQRVNLKKSAIDHSITSEEHFEAFVTTAQSAHSFQLICRMREVLLFKL